MKISKYQTPEGRCIIKSNTYSHSFEFISQLVALAKADFPDLKDSDIEIKVYNDNRWGKQTAIEFKGAIREDYEVIEVLPYTYN